MYDSEERTALGIPERLPHARVYTLANNSKLVYYNYMKLKAGIDMDFCLYRNGDVDYSLPTANIYFENLPDFKKTARQADKLSLINSVPLYDDKVFEREEIMDLLRLVNRYLAATNKELTYLDLAELINLRNLCIAAWNLNCNIISRGD